MTSTPLGQLVVERSRALLADVEALSSEIGVQREGRGGHLRLGVIPYVSSKLMEQLVSVLLSDLGMTVSLVEGATGPLVEELRLAHLHAVIGRCSMQPVASDLKREVLFTQRACLLVHAGNELSTNIARLSAFADHRWVAPPRDSPTWKAVIKAYWNARSTLPTPVVETASTPVVHALVSSNRDMVAVLPHDVGLDLERLGGVKVAPFPATLKMPPVGLIVPSRHWEFSVIASLRKTLRSLIANRGTLR